MKIAPLSDWARPRPWRAASLLLVPGIAGAKTTTLYVAPTGVNAGNACQSGTARARRSASPSPRRVPGRPSRSQPVPTTSRSPITKPLTIDGARRVADGHRAVSRAPRRHRHRRRPAPVLHRRREGHHGVTIENLGVNGSAAVASLTHGNGCAPGPGGHLLPRCQRDAEQRRRHRRPAPGRPLRMPGRPGHLRGHRPRLAQRRPTSP